MNVKNIEKKGNEATIVVEIDKELMESGVVSTDTSMVAAISWRWKGSGTVSIFGLWPRTT